jgi:hypothetical protein
MKITKRHGEFTLHDVTVEEIALILTSLHESARQIAMQPSSRAALGAIEGNIRGELKRLAPKG